MKKKEKKELRSKTVPELKTMLADEKKALFTMKLEKSQFKLKNLRGIFQKRKLLARIQTYLKEKELLENEKSA